MNRNSFFKSFYKGCIVGGISTTTMLLLLQTSMPIPLVIIFQCLIGGLASSAIDKVNSLESEIDYIRERQSNSNNI